MDRPHFTGEKNKEIKEYVIYLYDEIALLRSAMEKKPEFKAKIMPKPAIWSMSKERVDHGWRPKDSAEPLGFWLDPGNVMRDREEVPAEELQKWESAVNGENE